MVRGYPLIFVVYPLYHTYTFECRLLSKVHVELSLLKARAWENIERMSLTLEIFQEEISWLNEVAQANIKYILVTFEVFQEEISWLKTGAL